MQTIALPQKVGFEKSDKPNAGRITIEPCYPGYGITLGNSIRRVMISSLPGAAPVGIKIKGVDHEFMALPHLREDILEFVMNLKNLRLKVHTDEIVKLELDVYGEKEVRAGDIKKNAEAEVANPDLVLGHITDMSGSLQAEIYVSRGMGYVTVENRENRSKEIGYIEMDSIFSPVISVGVRVENVRVGKMTNWDKIILDVITDGTITPEEAFAQSVGILIKQFRALAGEVDEEDKEKEPEGVTERESGAAGGDGDDAAGDKETTDEIPAEEKEEEPKTGEADEEKPKRKRGRPKKVAE